MCTYEVLFCPLVAALAATTALGQEGLLHFEVASVKRLKTGTGDPVWMAGGPGTDNPGRLTLRNVPVIHLVSEAYDIPFYRILNADLLLDGRYEILATIPTGTTKEQYRVMLQNLLTDRFHLKLHHETKSGQTYELVVADIAPRLKETQTTDAPKIAGSSGPVTKSYKFDAKGFPEPDGPGIWMAVTRGPTGHGSHLAARAQSMTELADFLGRQLEAPVSDETGLSRKFDFMLEYAPLRGPQPDDGRLPDLQIALDKQLGLRLVSKKAPVDMIVVDHVDKMPTEN